MSLFVCMECGCVENTNLCTPLDRKELDENFPNLFTMEMHGFSRDFDDSEDREIRMLCSECNTGIWHGEFEKTQATDVELRMAELQGEMTFTLHPLYKKYEHDPDSITVEMLDEMVDSRNEEHSYEAMFKDKLQKLNGKSIYDTLGWGDTINPFVREEPKIGRNELCPCGSGKKYKKCCLS